MAAAQMKWNTVITILINTGIYLKYVVSRILNCNEPYKMDHDLMVNVICYKRFPPGGEI